MHENRVCLKEAPVWHRPLPQMFGVSPAASTVSSMEQVYRQEGARKREQEEREREMEIGRKEKTDGKKEGHSHGKGGRR